MTELTQKVIPDTIGIGYYVVEREEVDPDGSIVNVPAIGVSKVEADVIRMREQFISFNEIAEKLGITVLHAQTVYYQAMNRDYEQVVESMNAIRYSELILLEGQIKHLLEMQKLMPDNLEVTKTLIVVLNRRSKLLGLDAPERIQAQVQVSSFEEQLKVLDASFIEVIEDALTAENSKRTLR